MKIIHTQHINLKTEESIKTASLASPNEITLLMSSGKVVSYDIIQEEEKDLFSTDNSSNYRDGGFDVNAATSIYTMDSIVVIVNDYKRHGFVHYPSKFKTLHLWRSDYHANISKYPIALFKNELGVPHLIYGEAWNHLQIMNLDSRQILTASKSLIEEGAEERHLAFYQKFPEDNKHPWPRPYDYFYGELQTSPDQKHLLSAGWVWGSFDAYNVYSINDFIKNNRISAKGIGGWEHDNRACCWIDNETVAVIIDPCVEDEENANQDSPQEIHFFKLGKEGLKIERKVKIKDLEDVKASLHFNKRLNSLVLFSKKTGVLILSLDGEILFCDKHLVPSSYNSELNLFIKTNDKGIDLFQIEEGN